MQGIEILNTITEMKPNSLLLFICVFCFAFGLSLFVGNIGRDCTSIEITVVILSLTTLVSAILMATNFGATPVQQYEAIISEEVPIKEIYGKYEVVEQRGEIWILEDKE